VDVAPSARQRILVVDDDDAICDLLLRSLAADYDVTAACDGIEALDRFERGERFDLILADVTMPRMTGPELHAALFALAREQSERIVFLTASDCEHAPGGLPNTVLRKPMSLPLLRKVVRALLM
jgi:CheY-like chemotaxis protein